MQLTSLSLALTRAGLGGFSPSSLFLYGEQGAWYDPSDFNRYMSSLGPELVGASGWVTAGTVSIATSGNSVTCTHDGAAVSQVSLPLAVVAGRTYRVSGAVSAGATATTSVSIRDSALATSSSLVTVFLTANLDAGSGTAIYTAASSGTVYLALRIASGATIRTFSGLSVRELTAIATATLFQDAAGATPVTAVEQPVGLMLDKSKGLVLGPELFPMTQNFIGAGWTATGAGSSISLSQDGAGSGGVARIEYALSNVVCVTTFTVSGPGTVNFRDGTLVIGANLSAGTYTFRAKHTSNWNFAPTGSVVTITNVSVRELPGNHAYQTTSTSRPVLSARYNLLTKTERFDDAVWVKEGVTAPAGVIAAPDGTMTAQKLQPVFSIDPGNSVRVVRAYTAISSLAGDQLTFSVYVNPVQPISRYPNPPDTIEADRDVRLVLSADVSGGAAYWNCRTKTFELVAGGISAQSVNVGGGWFKISITYTAGSNDAVNNHFLALSNRTELTTFDPYPSGLEEIYIWGASLVPANQASIPYQRVNTATDYDADPAKFKPYLKFDGVDDFLVTNSIDFTSTDKMTVFAGVRKLSDASDGVVAELSSSTIAGTFDLFAPAATSATYRFRNRGTSTGTAISGSTFAAPITSVLTGLGDISGDSAILRVNGTQAAIATADQGTGTYGNYPLYIGRRGGTTLPFNGQLYSLIVRGAQTSDTQVSQTETWVNGKTGAY